MKVLVVVAKSAVALLYATATAAFSPLATLTTTTRSSPLALQASRRDFIAAAVATTTTTATLVTQTTAHAAEVDYERIQDLLKSTEQPGLSRYDSDTTTATTPKRPTYLTEPTDEFKENESKAMEFKRAQLQRKQQFNAILQKLQTDPNDAAVLAADLQQLTDMVSAGGGLPLGVSKEDVVKQVRRRKAQKFWPTTVEVAYQDLMDQVRFQQSPNKERDENFL